MSESHRQPFAGLAERGRPILELGPTGPHRGRVRVVPVGRLSRDRTRFEVIVEWTGPGLPGLPPAPGGVEAQDTHQLEDQELATGIAHAAHDLLQAGELPFLRFLHVALEKDGAGWRRRYEGAVGDAGKAAADPGGLL